MGFSLSFNAATVAPNVTPEPVPSGIYDVVITSTEEKPAKSTPGATFYEFEMQIQTGEYKGRKLFERLNCKNPSQQAVDIAYGTLSAICHVTGVMQVGQSSQELHGKPFKVNVVKTPRNDDPTKETNEIRGYLDTAGNPPGKAAGGATGAQQDANAAAFGAQGTATTNAPAAPAAPGGATALVDPLEAAKADGWLPHPQSPPHMYKGQEVKTIDEVKAMYPSAPAGATTPPPAAPAAPATGGQQADTSGVPSWAQ